MATLEVGGRQVEVTHPDRVVFPDVGLTKGDVVEYYRRVADRLVPHVAEHPVVMRRYPEGIDGGGFFQKQVPDHFPDWIQTVTLEKVEGGKTTYALCDDAATLAYIANQGTIELHTLLGPADHPRRPDRLILDLDPSTEDRESVVEGARLIRELFEEMGVTGFPSSTGSRGIHVLVLLDRSGEFDQSRAVARRLAEIVASRDPDTFTVAHSKAGRGDRLFVDSLRNGYGQHAIAPFSVRARPEAPVAVPLTWTEATSASFDPHAVTVRNLWDRLESQDTDPWKGMGRHVYSLSSLERRLDRLG